MKKLITFLTLLFISSTSFAQLNIDQSIVTPPPYKVGDTITVKYNIIKGTTNPRYIWLRYQYDNKSLTYVSTTFTQGSSVQTYYTGWNNYNFTPSTSDAETNLYSQYLLSPWKYTSNPDWNVGQLTLQRTDAAIDGTLATQKYIIKDRGIYNNIHKIDIAYSINDNSTYISPITRPSTNLSITNVTGNTSQFKVKVLFPTDYPITNHNVQLMYIKSDGSGDIDWTKQPIAVLSLDASGEATFTSGVKVGDTVGVFISPTTQKSFMNNIVTVSDAYRAFLGYAQTDISGASTFFTYPNLEKKIGLVSKSSNTFSESDSYYMFSYIMGINVSDKASIPTSAAPVNQMYNFRWYSGLLNQSWLDGVIKNSVMVTAPNQVVTAVFSWGGDLDWSHSSSPSAIASSISNGIYTNSSKITSEISTKTMSIGSLSYNKTVNETATLSVLSKIENDKIVLYGKLTKENLAGLQVVMDYDQSKLSLDNVIFDSGNTITNFSTHEGNRLTFGSIDQLKTARIKVGTPYKLIFTPKSPLTNTMGLFYFVMSDAVDANGNKIDLIIE
jgi:hypothetical protein